jgi:UDP-glucose 4-epimerase
MRRSFHKAHILVIGGCGFIGSHLADKLLSENASRVIILDNMFLGKMENINDALDNGAVFIKDDAEFDGVLEYTIKKHKIEVVFNCATKALNYSFINPINAYMTNVAVLGRLLELQREGAFETLCHFSSSEVYGSAVYEPMDENHPLRATTAYAAGKAAADLLLRAYVNQYELDAFIVRPFNNYGPRQNYEGALAGIIPSTIKRIMLGEPPEIHGTGEQSRDWIYVLDTVDAVLRLFDRMPRGEAVNISTGGQISMNELVRKISSQMGYDGLILRKPARSADVMCHNAGNAKMKSMIKMSYTPFDEGLRKTLAWYKQAICS